MRLAFRRTELCTTQAMTAQVHLSESENELLQRMVLHSGKSQEQLIHEAIALFLAGPRRDDRLRLLRQARGIWQGHQSIPDPATLREEWNRS